MSFVENTGFEPVASCMPCGGFAPYDLFKNL